MRWLNILTHFTAASISLAVMAVLNFGLQSYSRIFSIFITGSVLISCFFSSTDVEVASHLMDGDFKFRVCMVLLLLFIASGCIRSISLTSLMSISSFPNCFKMSSANELVIKDSLCDKKACSSWSETPLYETKFLIRATIRKHAIKYKVLFQMIMYQGYGSK